MPTLPASSNSDGSTDADKNVATVIYALQAATFFTGITLLISVIVAYVKREDVQGTWLESHFKWQITTFWSSFLWSVVGVVTLMIGVGFVILFFNSIWLIYRIAKGWLRLNDGEEMYA